MIRYALRCSNGHDFESWFQSADAYEKLRAAGMVACAECGATEVEKSLMTPSLGPSTRKEAANPPATAKPPEPSAPASRKEALAALKKAVEANSDYVGENFVSEALAMHEGTAPERAIYGEARVDEAKKLIEDGVPVAPLPFTPSRKTN